MYRQRRHKRDSDKVKRDYLDVFLSERYMKIDKLISERRGVLLGDLVSGSVAIGSYDKIGQSGSFTNSTEEMNVRFASDKMILKLESEREAINQLLTELNEEDKKIFYLRWGRDSQYEWMDIFYMMQDGPTGYLYQHKNQLYRRRNFILDRLAELLYMK